MICSKAPVRICDIGGWTDTWFFPRGAVFNICVDLYNFVRIVEHDEQKINIISENLGLRTEITDYKNIEYDGTLDLLKAAVKRMQIQKGIDIIINAKAPPGCGTGTSASVAVALIAALSHLSQKRVSPKIIAELAHKLEIEELKLESGVQDQYAAALGGINFMEVDYPSVKTYPVQIDEKKIFELENQLILVYLSSRSSNEMHKAVIKNFEKGDKSTLESFEIMKKCAYKIYNSFGIKSLEEIGEIMNENWEAQKKLHKLMVNPIIKRVESIAKEYGAVGFKINGAGGGGSATVLAGIGNESQLKKKYLENGFQVLPIKLDFNGVQTWEA